MIPILHRGEELDLSGPGMSDAGVRSRSALDRLRMLWLTGTPITDGSVESLAKLKTLEVLDVDQTQMSDGAQQRLRRELPRLAGSGPEPPIP